MTLGLRRALGVLSSLAVLWTVLALIGYFTMGGMMGGMMGMGTMGGQGMMRGDSTMSAHHGMGGMMMGGMVLDMGLTWLVMLGLDGVFVYLLASGRRARRAGERQA